MSHATPRIPSAAAPVKTLWVWAWLQIAPTCYCLNFLHCNTVSWFTTHPEPPSPGKPSVHPPLTTKYILVYRILQPANILVDHNSLQIFLISRSMILIDYCSKMHIWQWEQFFYLNHEKYWHPLVVGVVQVGAVKLSSGAGALQISLCKNSNIFQFGVKYFLLFSCRDRQMGQTKE